MCLRSLSGRLVVLRGQQLRLAGLRSLSGGGLLLLLREDLGSVLRGGVCGRLCGCLMLRRQQLRLARGGGLRLRLLLRGEELAAVLCVSVGGPLRGSGLALLGQQLRLVGRSSLRLGRLSGLRLLLLLRREQLRLTLGVG